MPDLEIKSSEQITLTKILQVQKDAIAKGDRLKADQIQKQLEEFGIKDIQKAIESGLKNLTAEQEFALKQIIEKYPYEKGESIAYFVAREGYKKSDKYARHRSLDVYVKNIEPNSSEYAVLVKDSKIILRTSIIQIPITNHSYTIATIDFEDIGGNMSSIMINLDTNTTSVKAFNH